MSALKIESLHVPGAIIYYEVRGSGPILLMISAGAGGAESYSPLFDYLADSYTIVTYDRRGYLRSPLDNPNEQIQIETHSADISFLLSALGAEPAHLFGCSIGALIGLDFTLRHPSDVNTLVAHEPPVGQLLPRSERADASLPELFARYGANEAIRRFAISIGVKHESSRINIGLPQESLQRADENREIFFKHDVGAVARYVLDIDTLKSITTRIVVAGGETSSGYFPYRCAALLAKQLGTQLLEFPGNHAGFVDYPEEFANRLRVILDN